MGKRNKPHGERKVQGAGAIRAVCDAPIPFGYEATYTRSSDIALTALKLLNKSLLSLYGQHLPLPHKSYDLRGYPNRTGGL